MKTTTTAPTTAQRTNGLPNKQPKYIYHNGRNIVLEIVKMDRRLRKGLITVEQWNAYAKTQKSDEVYAALHYAGTKFANDILNVSERKIAYQHKKLLQGKITTSMWWGFLETLTPKEREALPFITANNRVIYERLQDYTNSPLFRNKIRKYCNRVAGGDSYPYEVVKVLSNSRILIRYMHYECKNGQFIYTSCTEEQSGSFEIKLTKKGWGSGQYVMSDAPCYTQDPSF